MTTLYLILAGLAGAAAGAGGLAVAARMSDRVFAVLGGGGPTKPVPPR